MIQLKIKRTNTVLGSWKCEEMISDLSACIGLGKSIQEAINDYIEEYKLINGFTPDYKWS